MRKPCLGQSRRTVRRVSSRDGQHGAQRCCCSVAHGLRRVEIEELRQKSACQTVVVARGRELHQLSVVLRHRPCARNGCSCSC